MSAYTWEETGTDTLTTSCRFMYYWELFVGDFLDEELNIVEFHVEKMMWSDNSWNLVVGVCSTLHDRSTALGSNNQAKSREFNGWGFIANGCKNHANSAGTGLPYSPRKRLKDGDVVRMVYNKTAKTLSFELNEVDLGEAFNNVTGRVRIAASSTCKYLRLKLLRSTSSGILLEKITEEEKERLNFIVEKLGEVKVPLQNKTLILWKPFLRFQNNSIKNLRNLSLCVEERIIIYLLFSKETEIRKECLVDYFMFYKILGQVCYRMKHQIYNVLTKTNRLTLEELYFCFKDIIMRFENERIQSLLLFNENDEDEDSNHHDHPQEIHKLFDHSFTLWVFNRMKYKLQGIDRESDRYKRFIEYNPVLVPFLVDILDRYTVKKVVGSESPHSDFEGIEIESVRRNSFKKMNLVLWKTKKYHNVVLETLDGGSFKGHIELLCWNFNFFHRMIRFGGKEANSFRENGTIFLEHWEKKELESLLEFCYTETVTTRDLRTILVLFIHSEKFKETQLQKKMLELIGEYLEISNSHNEEELKMLISEFGYLFEENEEVSKLLLPMFEKRMGKKEIKKLIQKSDEKMEVQIVILNLQKKVMQQDEVIKDQSLEIVGLKNTIDNHQIEIDELKKLFKIHFNNK